MKKHLLLFLITFLTLPCAMAQDKKDRAKMMEELQQFKLDYLAKEMQLSEKEKAEFVPLYKEYDKERRQAGSEAWKFERELKKKNNASEADYKKLSELQQAARAKDNEIVKKYDSKFESTLSAKQIYTMHQAEEKFFEKMKEMRKKNHGEKHPHDKKESKAPGKKHKDHNDGFDAPEAYPHAPLEL
ncbi:MAG: hypothetical protein K2J46_10290 [Muribaculaceae bacterium]|nr:hypothetical protein [Muribaculaceae bacterium]